MTAIILAAGRGTRMNSDRPKVLHEVAGRAMLAHVVRACRRAGSSRLLVVVGFHADMVRGAFANDGRDMTWVAQAEQLGTGHAVMCCRNALAEVEGSVLIVAGDVPLIRPETLRKIVAEREKASAACTLATCIMPDPKRYGRIVRDAAGNLAGIVEYLDADDGQRKIDEVNVSIYCFDAAALRRALPKLKNDNAKKEYYLTDALAILRNDGQKLTAVAAVPPAEVMGVNTPEELAEANRILSGRAVSSNGAGKTNSAAKGSDEK